MIHLLRMAGLFFVPPQTAEQIPHQGNMSVPPYPGRTIFLHQYEDHGNPGGYGPDNGDNGEKLFIEGTGLPVFRFFRQFSSPVTVDLLQLTVR